jgi:hypothetical protein
LGWVGTTNTRNPGWAIQLLYVWRQWR